MTFGHFRKSWGAEPVDGGWEFSLWAPHEERLSLRARHQADMPMEKEAEGWFRLRTDEVEAGQSYAFVLADGRSVPDPAARAQARDVHGPSRLVDPLAYEWVNPDWKGRPWEETVFYELHTGTFSREGTFDGIRHHLDHLAGLGVTAVELLPVAQFSGERGWGYDGVLPYAPHRAYGGPEGLKRLVDEAHGRGLMMFLDVVYNHFGPDGNYLSLYAPDFFHDDRHTPWGDAIAYDLPPVRNFFIENALFWLEEYRFDGLRLDAINHIDDQSEEPLLEELGAAVRARITDRHVHMTTEDDRNIVNLHERDGDGRPKLFSGEWNDDVHHVFHVIATGEAEGYYCDYVADPVGGLARALATGFVYQGEASENWKGKPRGVPSGDLPPSAFVDFLQNHDQVGNRGFGERIGQLAKAGTVEMMTAVLLLSPHIPLLFMGEEWDEARPFLFFTDFHGELGDAVREGRRREFAAWEHFSLDHMHEQVADPNDEATFLASKLDWENLERQPNLRRLQHVRDLLRLRQREIVPLIGRIGGDAGSAERLADRAFRVTWTCDDGVRLMLLANFGREAAALDAPPGGRVVFVSRGGEAALAEGRLPATSAACVVAGQTGGR